MGLRQRVHIVNHPEFGKYQITLPTNKYLHVCMSRAKNKPETKRANGYRVIKPRYGDAQ